MDSAFNRSSGSPENPQAVRRPAYDPNNLRPLDEEARKADDTSEGIDWDEILATTEDDYLAGRYAFNSADYPDHESAMAGLEQWMDSILERVLRREATSASRTGSAR